MTARKDNEQAIVRQLIAEHSYGGWEKAWWILSILCSSVFADIWSA
jgi:hypothetical protein